MSSLSKQVLFFLVFSILCNLTTSNDVKDCINNLYEVFDTYTGPHRKFEIAMSALSEKLLSSIFTPNELFKHFVEHDDAIKNIGAGIFSKKHRETLKHYSFLSSMKDAADEWPKYKSIIKRVVNSRSIKDSSDSIADSSSAIGDSSTAIGDSSTAIGDSSTAIEDSSSANNINKKANILGYFRSFAQKIKKHGSIIDGLMLSPKKFCLDHDKITCSQALCTMLKLETTETHSLMNMKGSEALRYCFLNYTYLDFTTDTFFPDGSSSSLGEIGKQKLVDIMILYFNHMLDVATKIGEINKEVGKYGERRVLGNGRYVVAGEPYQDPPIFLYIEEYCQTAPKNK